MTAIEREGQLWRGSDSYREGDDSCGQGVTAIEREGQLWRGSDSYREGMTAVDRE